MPKIVQEKFQVTLPDSERQAPGWASEASARQKKGTTPGQMKNHLPHGANIENQALTDQHALPRTMAGESDVSRDANVGALERGYTKKAMRATDDEYSSQHNDAFYDDVGGFVERNNMLDRL